VAASSDWSVSVTARAPAAAAARPTIPVPVPTSTTRIPRTRSGRASSSLASSSPPFHTEPRVCDRGGREFEHTQIKVLGSSTLLLVAGLCCSCAHPAIFGDALAAVAGRNPLVIHALSLTRCAAACDLLARCLGSLADARFRQVYRRCAVQGEFHHALGGHAAEKGQTDQTFASFV
jgi:hypothetical protein